MVSRAMTVVTRFAPSPTGYLHIGSARTALFNWLFARRHGGRFLLRIEDTDRARSTPEAVQAIIDGLRWLGLDWDGDPVFQSRRAERHVAAAETLLAEGKAYRCFASPEELAEMRESARAAGRGRLYDGRWRDRDPAEAPPGVRPVIRFKAPLSGVTRIRDLVQGEVAVANDQLDDMVLLRADGTPTYMLAVVVDDRDMGITHIIRGTDHLTNAFRQLQLYLALGCEPPAFAHIPLIHGADGAKLSKRHGALGVDAYRDQGILAEALCNYLLRLGWSHGDDEIISRDQAIAWFDLDGVGRSAARFDMAKLLSLNARYLRLRSDGELADLVLAALRGRPSIRVSASAAERLLKGMSSLKERAKTLDDLADAARFYVIERPVQIDPKAMRLLTAEARARLHDLTRALGALTQWTAPRLEEAVRRFVDADRHALKLGDLAQPLRAALTGSTASPPIFEVMEVLGRVETIARLEDALDEGT